VVHVLWKPKYVRQCVEQGGKINEYSNDGMTPLAVAAFWGYADIAEFLLEIFSLCFCDLILELF
jgi:ankyrin repeat protein